MSDNNFAGLLPDAVAAPAMRTVGIDRWGALYSAIDIVLRRRNDLAERALRRDDRPLPLMTMFDKQIQLRMGQSSVRKLVDDIMPVFTDDDPLGVDTCATHS